MEEETRIQHQALSDACHSYIVGLGSVYPGVSRQDGERLHLLALMNAIAAHALPTIPVSPRGA